MATYILREDNLRSALRLLIKICGHNHIDMHVSGQLTNSNMKHRLAYIPYYDAIIQQ
jgi:hypothetical protein